MFVTAQSRQCSSSRRSGLPGDQLLQPTTIRRRIFNRIEIALFDYCRYYTHSKLKSAAAGMYPVGLRIGDLLRINAFLKHMS